MRFKLLCFFGPIVIVLPGFVALAQPTPPPAPPSKAATSVFEVVKAAFEALSLGERKEVQEALVWTGDYNGIVGTEFGRRTFEAIEAYARRAGLPLNGVLDAPARKGLLAAANQARQAARFTVVSDPATGIRIGVPEGILVKQGANGSGGTRWQSADGKITLDTRAIPPGAGDLTSHFERNLATEVPGRQVTYKLLRPDFFVVAGETPTGKFYMRYAPGPTGLRGFHVGYEKSLAKTFDRIVLAIANSFVPFPEAARPVVGGQTTAVHKPLAIPPERPRTVRLVGSGLAVSPGLILTSGALGSCAEPRVAGVAASVVRIDKDADLAVLKPATGPRLPETGLELLSSGVPERFIVLSYARTFSGKEEVIVTPADALAPGLLAPLQPGASGAPVFDRNGALVAVVGTAIETPREVAGVAPAARWPMISGERIKAFLGEGLARTSEVPPSRPATTSDIVAQWRARIFPITCE